MGLLKRLRFQVGNIAEGTFGRLNERASAGVEQFTGRTVALFVGAFALIRNGFLDFTGASRPFFQSLLDFGGVLLPRIGQGVDLVFRSILGNVTATTSAFGTLTNASLSLFGRLGGLVQLIPAIGRGSFLLQGLLFFVSELRSAVQRIRGQTFASLSILEKISRVITIIDTGMTRVFNTTVKTVTSITAFLAVLSSPFFTLVGVAPLLNIFTNIILTTINKIRDRIARIFGSSRAAFTIAIQEIRQLFQVVLQPVIQFAKNFKRVQSNAEAAKGSITKFVFGLRETSAEGKALASVRLPIGAQLQSVSLQLQTVLKEILFQINLITGAILRSSGLTKDQIKSIQKDAETVADITSKRVDGVTTRFNKLLTKNPLIRKFQNTFRALFGNVLNLPVAPRSRPDERAAGRLGSEQKRRQQEAAKGSQAIQAATEKERQSQQRLNETLQMGNRVIKSNSVALQTMKKILDGLVQVVDKIKNATSGLGQGSLKNLQAAGSVLRNLGSGLSQGIVKSLQGAGNILKTLGSGLGQGIGKTTSTIVNFGKSLKGTKTGLRGFARDNLELLFIFRKVGELVKSGDLTSLTDITHRCISFQKKEERAEILCT